MKGIIIILAHANDDKGNLSEISKERLNLGKEISQKNPEYKIILTGGYGDNFNSTKKPHHLYSKKYLLKNGVNEEIFLQSTESSNTVHDALDSKPIVEKYSVKNLTVISSDYHIKRVKYIFRSVFSGYKLNFFSSKTKSRDLLLLKKHEKEALVKLRKLKKFY